MAETFCMLLGDMILIMYVKIKVIGISIYEHIYYILQISYLYIILINKLEKLREHKLKISQYKR